MKFAERLAAHITPEWSSQYIKYDELKELLYTYEANAPIADDEHLLQRYFARADEEFFQICDKELIKINSFFAEKLAEAMRKFINLKTELKEFADQRSGRRIVGGTTTMAETSAAMMSRSRESVSGAYDKNLYNDDDDDDDDDETKRLAARKRRRSTNASLEAAANAVLNGAEAEAGADSTGFARRLLEKGQQQRMKRKQVRKEHDLKLAFSEFYLSLILLQNYQQLNITGFRKILKKHDKVFKTDRGNEWHKNNVETAAFYTSKKVDQLITDVENLFTQYLEKGDRQRAMKRLRVPPFEEKQTPWTTFRIGLFLGMIAALVPLFILLSVFVYENEDKWPFAWKAAIKLYRGTLFLVIHIVFIGINAYGWSRSGVNHILIFEVDPRNHLTYQQLIEIGAGLMVLWLISVFSFMISAYLKVEYYVHPLCLIVILVLYLINPIPRFQHSSRLWILKVLGKIFSAPMHMVTFAQFWLADQLYWAPFKGYFDAPCQPKNNRDLSKVYNIFLLLMICLPSWLRFLQCLRRYRDTGQWFPHLVNAGKYASTFFDIGFLALKYHFSAFYKNNDWESPFFYLWLIVKIISSTYKLIWDLKMDWGFFDGNAGENKYLREVIVYSSKSYYYFAIIEDIILRYIWIVRIYDINMKQETYKDLVSTALAFLEMWRRFVWNFFRLENEHLNNCGQFRAVRDISISPLQVTDLAIIEQMMDTEDGIINRQQTLNVKPYPPPLSASAGSHHEHTLTKRFISKHPNILNIARRFNAATAAQSSQTYHPPPSRARMRINSSSGNLQQQQARQMAPADDKSAKQQPLLKET